METDSGELSWDLSLVDEGYDIVTVESTSLARGITWVSTEVMGTGNQASLDSIWATERPGEQAPIVAITDPPVGSVPSTTTKDSTSSSSTVLSSSQPASPSDQATETPMAPTEPSTQSNVPTIAGVSVGVPVGLAAIALILYILRRRHTSRAIDTHEEATQSFPPDPKSAAESIYQKSELRRP